MRRMPEILEREIYPFLPETIVRILRRFPEEILERAVEIRLGARHPLRIVLPQRDYMIGADGKTVDHASEAYHCVPEEIARIVQAASRNSMYAMEQELRLGYMTLAGGHRIGLAGQAVVERGELKALKHIGSLNIRLARETPHCADFLLPYLIASDGRVYNTLVISPPRCGKTTLLRDIARGLSDGGIQVGVVDERSEIAACKDGAATADLGGRADVLDGCPKAVGMLMLIRTMSPAVVITDELGRDEDAVALLEALHAGVRVVATAHGAGKDDIARRPRIGALVKEGYFDRYVLLTDRPRVGTIQEIFAADSAKTLYAARFGRDEVC